MIYSSNVLLNPLICAAFFKKGLTKSKALLTEIFGLNFEGDERIIELKENPASCCFEVTFDYGRKIKADFLLEEKEKNKVHEVLRIFENSEEIIKTQEKSFSEGVKHIQSVLEERFSLDLVPLDLDVPDPNIISVHLTDQSYKVSFRHDDHEGHYTATYYGHQNFFTLIKHSCIEILMD